MEHKIKPGVLQFWMTTFFLLSWPSSFWELHVVFVFPAANPNLRWCCWGRPCTSCWRGAFWSLSCSKGGQKPSEWQNYAKLSSWHVHTCYLFTFCIILHHVDIFWIILAAICRNEIEWAMLQTIYINLWWSRGSKGVEDTGSKMKPRVGQYSARPCLSLLVFHTDSHRFWFLMIFWGPQGFVHGTEN